MKAGLSWKRLMTQVVVMCTGALCLLQQASAQVFGGNPPRLKFYQLNTDTVRIIFPKELERQAREVAGLTHVLARQSPAMLGNRLTKYDVVLQNQTTLSNAYVGIAPRRSEYYMMPELSNLELTSLPWHQTLAIHEFRHVEQFSNFNRNVQRTLGFFLGQEGQALAMGAAVPDWFWEGDAVWQETVSTRQGRGALPHFMNAYRSLWTDGKKNTVIKNCATDRSGIMCPIITIWVICWLPMVANALAIQCGPK